MIGFQADHQERLFYSFNLEDHVPQNHLLRGIDRHLDLSDLRQHLGDFYSHTGRPSVAPELMIRMLIIGYSLGIRSERRLCEEVHLNLAYRWFCRLGLEDRVPDHSTFSKNRHGRFRESGAFRHLFESVLQRCMAEGLVPGEGFATDASIIKAIPLSNTAVLVLRKLSGKHQTHVFSYRDKPVMQPNNGAWIKALKRAGIVDFRWHDLRHTWASWHVQAGTPLHVLQELGGWESAEMVRRYAHLSSEHLAVYVEKFSGLQLVSGYDSATESQIAKS